MDFGPAGFLAVDQQLDRTTVATMDFTVTECPLASRWKW